MKNLLSCLLLLGIGACSAASQDLGNSDPHGTSGGPAPSASDTATPGPTTPPVPTTPPPTPTTTPPVTTPVLKWTARAAMPTRRSRLAALFAPNGKLYAIGGSTDTGPTGTVEVYDPKFDSWSTATPMPTPRYGIAAVLLTTGKIAVIGGQYDQNTTTDGVSGTVEFYDPVADVWTAGPSLPEGRYQGAGALRSDGSILFGGGLNANTVSNRASVYALADGATAWTLASPLTTPRGTLAMVAGADGTTYAIGGQDGESNPLATAEERGPSATAFSTLPSMPAARRGHSAVRGADGRIYVVGGGGGGPVLIFDPTTRAWTTAAAPPTCDSFSGSAVAPDGTIYALGGETSMYINDVIALAK